MRKSIFAIIAIAAVCGASAARAANAEPFRRPHRFSSQDLSAFADARIAALKTGLQLTPEQEKNWSPLEAALRELAKARIARTEEWRDKAPATFESDPLGALQRRARDMSARAADLDKVAIAAKPVYESLDEAQKRRFGALVKAAIAERAHHMRGMGHMGSTDRMGPGGFGSDSD
jgi:hypothetical protein